MPKVTPMANINSQFRGNFGTTALLDVALDAMSAPAVIQKAKMGVSGSMPRLMGKDEPQSNRDDEVTVELAAAAPTTKTSKDSTESTKSAGGIGRSCTDSAAAMLDATESR